MRVSYFVATGLLMLAAPASVLAACTPGMATYDYPEQRLDQALQQFAQTSGCPVAVNTGALGSTQANALDGQYTAADALIRLVRGSGFEVHLDNGRYRVNHADAQALQRRIKTLTRDIDSVADAQALSKAREAALRKQLGAVWTSAQRLIREQGFLSAAEKASYNRTFAYITGQLKTAVGR